MRCRTVFDEFLILSPHRGDDHDYNRHSDAYRVERVDPVQPIYIINELPADDEPSLDSGSARRQQQNLLGEIDNYTRNLPSDGKGAL